MRIFLLFLFILVFYVSNLFAVDCKIEPKDGYIKISDTCKNKGIYATSSLNDKKYSVKNLVDESTKTAWVEGVKGNGIGQKIFLNDEECYPFHTIKIFPGYGKSKKLFKANARPKKIAITLLEYKERKKSYKIMKSEEVNFEDEMKYQGFEPFVDIKMDDAKDYALLIEILSVYPGNKYEDLAISEIISEDNSFSLLPYCPDKVKNCVVLDFSISDSYCEESVPFNNFFHPIGESPEIHGVLDVGGPCCGASSMETAAVGPLTILTENGKYGVDVQEPKLNSDRWMGSPGVSYTLVDLKRNIEYSYDFLSENYDEMNFYVDGKGRLSFKSTKHKTNCLRIPEDLRDEFILDKNCNKPFKKFDYNNLPEKVRKALEKSAKASFLNNPTQTHNVSIYLSPDENYLLYIVKEFIC